MFAEDLKLTKSATVSTRTQRFNRSSFGVMPRRSPGERDPIGDPGLRIPTDVEVLPGTPTPPIRVSLQVSWPSFRAIRVRLPLAAPIS